MAPDPRPLPRPVLDLLAAHPAPPRLVAHLSLVHDVACELVIALRSGWPALALDDEAVRLGAAVHDLGKVLHRDELVRPGTQHESAGYELLVRAGWPPGRARFARTHGASTKAFATLALEDLVVILADTCWKGKRDADLETEIARRLAIDGEVWRAFAALDTIVERVAETADDRLAWQAAHGT